MKEDVQYPLPSPSVLWRTLKFFPKKFSKAALGRDRQSFRLHFWLPAEIISTAGKETQELPHQIRSVFHHILHHSPLHRPFQRLWGKVTEATLLECCGVKIPEGKCGWHANFLPPTRKIKILLCLGLQLLRQKGVRLK